MALSKLGPGGVARDIHDETEHAARVNQIQLPISSVVTSVASAGSDTQLLAVNTSRKMATFYNNSTSVAFLKLGTGASSSSFTIKLAAGSYYELPISYTGAIHAIWETENGDMQITELT